MQWGKLVPELTVSDLSASLRFYVDGLGFDVKFRRTDPEFAYLDFEGSQMMLEQFGPGGWNTDELVRPFGRGVNFQIECADAAALRDRALRNGYCLYRDLEEEWYDIGGVLSGQREFLIQDPDGYLLRFAQHLGEEAKRA